MIGRIRLVVALGWVAASTLVLVPLQLVAMKSRLWSEWRVPQALAPVDVRALGFRVHVSTARLADSGRC